MFRFRKRVLYTGLFLELMSRDRRIRPIQEGLHLPSLSVHVLENAVSNEKRADRLQKSNEVLLCFRALAIHHALVGTHLSLLKLTIGPF